MKILLVFKFFDYYGMRHFSARILLQQYYNTWEAINVDNGIHKFTVLRYEKSLNISIWDILYSLMPHVSYPVVFQSLLYMLYMYIITATPARPSVMRAHHPFLLAPLVHATATDVLKTAKATVTKSSSQRS
jgi:hypothetical protein